MFTRPLRSRWFALLIHVGLWLLLLLALAALGGRAPIFSSATTLGPRSPDPVPTSIIQQLFGRPPVLATLGATNLTNPFFTRQFEPPVVPPPTTRKVELTYHGFYQTADGPLTALLKIGEEIVPVVAGARALADLYVADITWPQLVLTNAAAQTNALPLNTKKAVDVPLP